MAKKDTKQHTLVDQVADETLRRLANGQSELGAAAPGEGDVDDPALSEMDVFAYCASKYIERGEPVTFCIFRNNAQIATEDHPYSWEQLQADYEPGHYMVKGRSVTRGCWVKTESRTIAAPASRRGAPGFRFGEQAEPQAQKPADPMSAILLMMQQSQEKAEARAAEQRERDEARRREDKILEDERRKQERESRNDLLKTLLPLALPLVEKVFSKKEGLDPSVSLVIDQLKESNRRLEDRLVAVGSQNNSVLDTKTLLDLEQKAREREAAARKEGREEMEKIYEIAEERAESRAAEMIQGQGEKDESMTAVLIKSLAPALGAMIAQQQSMGGAQPAQLPAGETPPGDGKEVISVSQEEAGVANVTPIRAQTGKPARTKPVAKPVAPRPRASQEDIDRQKIMEIVMPFLVDAFQRMAAGAQLTPEGAARESLELLALKGFRQDRVLQLFTRAHLEALVLSKLPEQYHSWFNKYYAALDFKPGTSSPSGSPDPAFVGTKPAGDAQVPVVESSGGNAG